MAKPEPEFYDEIACELAAQAFKDITDTYERRRLIPLLEEQGAIVYAVLRNVARQAISNTAEIQIIDGADTSGAILPKQPTTPPSPL